MTTTPRAGVQLVPAPSRTTAPGGLFGTLPQAGPLAMSGHTSMGIAYELAVHGDVSVIDQAASTVMATPRKDLVSEDFGYENGEPFTIWTAYKGDPLGTTNAEAVARAQAQMEARFQRGVELALWNSILPTHFGQDLNPAGAVDARAAIGILEEFADDAYAYEPTLHFGKRLAPFLVDHHVAKVQDNGAVTAIAAKAALGAGYAGTGGPATSPEDTTPIESGANARWMWVTGQVQVWADAPNTYAELDRNTNTLLAISERTVIVTIDGLSGAVRVNLS